MKIKKLLLACSFVLTLALQSSVFAAVPNAELEVRSASGKVGENAKVDVVINNPNGLKTFEFQLNYDNTALELSNSTCSKGDAVENWFYEYNVDNTAGTIRVAAVNSTGFSTDSTVTILKMNF